MSWGDTKDAGVRFKPAYAAAETSTTAGGAGDATEVNGAWIDTQGFNSLDVVLPFTATLAGGATLSVAANLQDADDISGTGAADVNAAYAKALSSTVQATGDSGGSTETGAVQIGWDLTMCKRFVRVQFTPDLSAANTDTAKIGALYVLGGGIEAPANPARVNLRANP